MILFFQKAFAFFAMHPMLNALAHVLAGFGIAVILQQYLKGNSFIPVMAGWLCVAISAAMHLYAIMMG